MPPILLLQFPFFLLFLIHFTEARSAGHRLLHKITPEENDKIQKFCNNSEFTGVRPNPIGLILGGRPVDSGVYPWVAAISYGGIVGKDRSLPITFCGGTIISQRHVITARHCIADLICAEQEQKTPTVWWIQVGGVCTNKNSTHNCTKMDMQKYAVNRAIYSSQNLLACDSEAATVPVIESDLAIIELAHDLDAAPFSANNKKIQVACLPNQETFAKKLHIYGWGNTLRNYEDGAPKESEHSEHLLQIELPVVEPDDPLHNSEYCRSKRLVCAHERGGGEQKDGAKGDSGTGIVGMHGEGKVLEAITTSGQPKKQLNIGLLIFPLAREICYYTGVCQKREWIANVNQRSALENGGGCGPMLKMEEIYEYRGGPVG